MWKLAAGRPVTRADCAMVTRPCPWVECRYHLGPEVNSLAPADFEPPESCALDVADAGPRTEEQIGELFACTRQSIQWCQRRALRKLSEGLTGHSVDQRELGRVMQWAVRETRSAEADDRDADADSE